MHEILSELHSRTPLLMGATLLFFVLAGAAVLAGLADSRMLLGVNPWLKPLKFCLSIALYLAALGWLLGDVEGPSWAKQAIAAGAAATMLLEIGCITMQSARGVPSHFNLATAFDGGVFGLMAAAIFLNSVLVAGLLTLFFVAPKPLPPAYLWGARLGLALFLLGSWQGTRMVSLGAHSVGGADGGPGLPFLNWSVVHGDLRAAHFIWLHGLQSLPLAGWLISRWGWGPPAQVTAVVLTAAGYMAAGLAAFRLAMAGRPLL